MPQLSAFKFLSSSAAVAPFRLRLPSFLPHTPRRSLTVLSANRRRARGGGGGVGSGGVLSQRRRKSSNGSSGGLEMEEREGMGFNRKRAEGRDGGKKRNLQLKVRKLNPVNTICYVQILGTGMDTQDTSPSILLFFDRQRIIFNAGEGLQRFCTEHKIKLSKIDHIFLTRVCSETASGIPGLLLTLANIGEEGMSVNVWGPSDLKYLIDAMRSFIPNAAMVHSHSFGETSNGDSAVLSGLASKVIDPIVLVNDEVVKISAILLQSRQPKKANGGVNYSQVPEFCGESSAKAGDVAVIYVCELPEIMGKFDPSKAKSRGLKPGPKYRELQLGNSVMSDSQSIMVHPTDVLGPSIPGPIVLLVDCPTTYHLAELVTLQSLNCYYTNSTGPQERLGAKSVNCIIHLGPSSVTKNAEYQNWMRRFAGAQHIMAGYEMGNIAFPVLASSAKVTARLNYVCPHLFPSPKSFNHQINNSQLDFNSSSEVSSSANNVSAENLLKFYLRPLAQLGLDRSMIPSVQTTAEIVNELLSEIPEIQYACKDVSDLWHGKRRVKNGVSPSNEGTVMTEEPWMGDNVSTVNTEYDPKVPSCLENITREDMEIVLLGTGSSQPSKYRNVSSIYVNLFSKGSILLDCGEGTLGQLKRRFGVKGADNAVKALRLIWISHIHADHHTGLARILALRCLLLKDQPHEPLLVVGPRPLKRFLDAYSQLEDLDMQFLDCRNTTEVSWNAIAESLGTDKNCSTEQQAADAAGADSVVTGAKSEDLGASRQNLRNTIFATCNKMQSVWKQPMSPVDTTITLPMLTTLKKVLSDAGLDGLYSVPVVHCPQAFGIVIQAAKRMNSAGKIIPGWKLVYSGDTRPCQALVDASRGATVLIHEATFEDGMEDEALARNHSTTMEAVNVGTTADAYRIILTHFSQRYPKIPVFDETHMSKTCIGFDMMSINAADLHVLPKVLPHLKLLFKNEMAPDESNDVVAVATTQ